MPLPALEEADYEYPAEWLIFPAVYRNEPAWAEG